MLIENSSHCSGQRESDELSAAPLDGCRKPVALWAGIPSGWWGQVRPSGFPEYAEPRVPITRAASSRTAMSDRGEEARGVGRREAQALRETGMNSGPGTADSGDLSVLITP